jgi:hypothetical protein
MTDPKKKQMRAAERSVKKLEPWRLAEIRCLMGISTPRKSAALKAREASNG